MSAKNSQKSFTTKGLSATKKKEYNKSNSNLNNNNNNNGTIVAHAVDKVLITEIDDQDDHLSTVNVTSPKVNENNGRLSQTSQASRTIVTKYDNDYDRRSQVSQASNYHDRTKYDNNNDRTKPASQASNRQNRNSDDHYDRKDQISQASNHQNASSSLVKYNDNNDHAFDNKKFDKILFCALSLPNKRHLIVKPVSLSCLDYACKDCLIKASHAYLKCNNCGQKFRKSDLDIMEECPLGKQLVKENLPKLYNHTLNEFENLKEEFLENIDMDRRINNQINSIKSEIRKRTDALMNELDELANSFDTQLNESKNKLRSTSKLNLPKYEQFQEKAMVRLEQLRKDVAMRENQNEEGFFAYQMTLQKMHEMVEELNWINPQIALQQGRGSLDRNLIGSVTTYMHKNSNKNREIHNRIKSGNFKIIDIEAQPWDVCPLPNGLLLIADLNQCKLYEYDENFKLLRTIDQLSEDGFYPMGICTNNRNEIYIVNHSNEKIYKTDMDFNQIGECCKQGTESNELTHPRGICFYNQYIYVCDCGNNRVQKFDTNLVFQASYALEYSPSRIKIANNLACIIGALNNNSTYFYDIKTFKLVFKYERKRGCGLIGTINSHFYEYNEKKIYCYDESGEIIDTIKTSDFGAVLDDYNYDSGITFYSNKIILFNYKYNKLVLI